jgi:S-adenosylmethionine hydrolase
VQRARPGHACIVLTIAKKRISAELTAHIFKIQMPFVTLTTDWGTRDHYVGALKGRLLSRIPEVRVIDISHDIFPFDTLQASYILKNAYHHFPEGTIHYSGMKGRLQTGALPELMIVESEGYYFVGIDSGLFSLVLEENTRKCYALPTKGHFNSGEWSEGIVDTISKLAGGESPASFATERNSLIQAFSAQPIIDADSIRATVIFIDRFENLVLNITEDLFNKVCGNRGFMIEMRRVRQPLNKISQWYNEVEEGEILALFNRDGYLEIALNRSNASGLLGVNLYEPIRIIFM